MKREPRLLRAGIVALLLAAAASGVASGSDGFSLYLEPTAGLTSSETTDETGNTTSRETRDFAHRYRLDVRRQLYPLLHFTGSGFFEQRLSTFDDRALDGSSDLSTWNGSGILSFGDQLLGGAGSYERRHEWGGSRLGDVRFLTPGATVENWVLTGRWRPFELPSFSVRFSRMNVFDDRRATTFTTNDDATLSATYRAGKLDTSYNVRYAHPVDHRTGTESTEVTQAARLSYADSFLAGRGSYRLGYGVSTRYAETSAGALGGLVRSQAFPTGGLSIVETFPATPEAVTLNPNAPLIDGDVRASAGINIGYSASGGVSGTAFRDLGVENTSPFPRVNSVHVWVDRSLSPDTIAAYTAVGRWTAYRSDDNATWTAVSVNAVRFGSFENRFEIDIADTEARYLKVVTLPLAAGVTLDPRFADVFVTEMQIWSGVPAAEALGSTTSTNGVLSGSARVDLLRDVRRNIAYQTAARLTHVSDPFRTAYSLENGVSYAEQLSRVFRVGAQLSRTDSEQVEQHVAENSLAASLSATPVPALAHVLSFNASLTDSVRGTARQASVALSNRAQVYEGVALTANAAYTRRQDERRILSQGRTASSGLTLNPHPTTSVSGTYGYSHTEQAAPGGADTRATVQFAQGSTSWTPLPAVFLAGGVSRRWGDTRATTLTSVSLGCSPLREGQLTLALSYSESYDSTSDEKTRTFSPSLRWHFAPRATLDATYSWYNADSRVRETTARAANLTLVIPLS